MLCFRVHKNKLVAIRKPQPTLKSGWALIRVRLAGICNTDVEILRGYHSFHGTPGHEFVGEVSAVDGVSQKLEKQWLGKRVCGEIKISCRGLCHKTGCDFFMNGLNTVWYFCRRGLKTHCGCRTVLGIVCHDGAFAEYLTLPLENLHVIPPSIS